jgi:hypothetical protein
MVTGSPAPVAPIALGLISGSAVVPYEAPAAVNADTAAAGLSDVAADAAATVCVCAGSSSAVMETTS